MNQNVKKQEALGRPSIPPPQRVPEGFLLIDQGDAWSWPKFIFGLLFLLGFCLSMPPMWINAITTLSVDAVLIASVFMLLGCVGIVVFIRGMRMVMRLTPGEIILPRWPLRMGESCEFRFRRQLRQGQVKQVGMIQVHLDCVESVRYRAGTETRTDSATRFEQELLTQVITTGISKIELNSNLSIPLDGPASFKSSNNGICWKLRVRIEIPGLVKDTSTFELMIDPEVAE